MSKAKVCMLTTDHSALDDRILYKESLSLRRAGHEVTLIAPLNEDGFLVDMGRKPIAAGETTTQGVRIIGFNKGKQGIPKLSTVLQLVRLASLARVRVGAERFADLISKGVSLSADVYHCHEIWSLYAGIQIKRRLEEEGRKPKLIYDVHEYAPALDLGSNIIYNLYQRALRKARVHFEKEALKYIDYVITANQITRGYLLTVNRFIQTEVIYNCPILSIFHKPRGSAAHKDEVVICHEGSLGFNRGLKQMIEVMKVLKEHYSDRVKLLIVGDVYGKEREYLELRVEEYKLQGVIDRTGWLPYDEVGKVISQADIGVIFMEPTENNMLAGPPNKLFNYMIYGLPVVSVDLPETSRIISETECGVVVRDRNTNSLAKALSALIDDEDKRRYMGESAKKAVYNQYSWERMEKRLLRVYTELLHPGGYRGDNA